MARPSLYEARKDDILRAIWDLAHQHGQPPSLREIKEKTGVSIGALHDYMAKLSEEGLVWWQPRSHRSIRLTPKAVQSVT